MSYRGRFAPSPTGPLHLGSALAAAASFIDARQAGGEWLVRIDDIDPPREQPGAADAILRALEQLGLSWDGPVLYQSTRHEAYRAGVEQLLRQGLAFRCSCSRAEIRRHADSGPHGRRYPGTCRGGPAQRGPTAVRALTNSISIQFDDRFQGPQCEDLQSDRGDYVIQRRDGLPAYHLAAVIDDDAQGITDVVRGADLLAATFAHCHLQGLLQLKQPRYGHIPLLVNGRGEKLSKQTGAAPLDLSEPSTVVRRVLACLGWEPPRELRKEPPSVLWQWAIGSASTQKLMGRSIIRLS